MTDRDMTALVSSRICHDLISPIGAICNGVELLGATGAPASPEIDLIGESAINATAKLKYFRIAFGAAPDGARIKTAEMQAAIDAMFQGRSAVALQTHLTDIPRVAAKALLLALMCQEKCLPLGGSGTVRLTGSGFEISTPARKTRDNAGLWAIVADPTSEGEVAPGDVQFLLLGEVLQQTGAALTQEITATDIRIYVKDLPLGLAAA